MFTAISAVKFAVSGVVGIGAGKIARTVIANNVDPQNLLDKITTVAGAWAIGGLVATAAKDHSDKTIDEVYEGVSKIVSSFKVAAKLDRISRNQSTFEQEGLDPTQYVKEADGKWHPIKTEEPAPAA